MITATELFAHKFEIFFNKDLEVEWARVSLHEKITEKMPLDIAITLSKTCFSINFCHRLTKYTFAMPKSWQFFYKVINKSCEKSEGGRRRKSFPLFNKTLLSR